MVMVVILNMKLLNNIEIVDSYEGKFIVLSNVLRFLGSDYN